MKLIEDFHRIMPEWKALIGWTQNFNAMPASGLTRIYVDGRWVPFGIKELTERNNSLPEDERLSQARLCQITNKKDMT